LNFVDNNISSMLESHEGKTNHPSPEEKTPQPNPKSISMSSAGIQIRIS
jgi:hypothetical protein